MIIDTATLRVKDIRDLKIKMLNWANRFNIFCFLDNNGYSFEDPGFECMLAVGEVRSFRFTKEKTFPELQQFFDASPSWLFGHLGYNAAGNAYSATNKTEEGFGPGFFFEPQIILRISGEELEILKTDIGSEILIADLINSPAELQKNTAVQNIKPTASREEYIESIAKLKHHIQRGDCYEINFCQKFIAVDAVINPVRAYIDLATLSPAPFAALYKLNSHYCVCASPERFLQKTGQKLISQPIKGTAVRDHSSAETDKLNKEYLLSSAKEKSENVMVADLVRNDLSMVCEKDSVKVKELCGIYSFPQVYQMITTIEGTLSKGKSFTEAIEACYPMGSMTGAPKQKVMELIESYETGNRGLFSGSIGYITPTGNFDFNVVIRSLFGNSHKNSLSFFAGSGITFYSNAADEYDECMAKASAIFKILSGK